MYSKSKRAVRKVQLYLDQMVAAEMNITFPDNDPTRLAYRIRDGIKAARSFPDSERYAKLSTKFIIRVQSGGVKCELRDDLSDMKSTMHNVISIEGVSDTLGIIGAAIKHKADVLNFPDARYSNLNLTPIENWASNNGYAIQKTEDHVSLIKVEHNQNGNGPTQYSDQ